MLFILDDARRVVSTRFNTFQQCQYRWRGARVPGAEDANPLVNALYGQHDEPYIYRVSTVYVPYIYRVCTVVDSVRTAERQQLNTK